MNECKCKNCNCDSHCDTTCPKCSTQVCHACDCEKCNSSDHEQEWAWQDSGIESWF